MDDALFWHRLQFAFTITYHYLFPQLTMGLAWFLVYWKWRALRTGDEKYNRAARFWAKIFGLNFAVGVVTGIPMEFQFGTNWAGFSRYAGGVIGQTLAMEGMFAFFLESAFIGALIWGEKRLGPRYHFLAALAVALGSWLSGYFILVTNAFMQHPVGYRIEADGSLGIDSLSALPAQSMGMGPVRPQSDGGPRNGLVRGGRRGRILHLARTPSGAGANVSARWNGHRADRLHPCCVPDRRPAGQDGWQSPAGDIGGHGGPIRRRSHGQRRGDRAAQCCGPAARQPDRDPGRPQLSRLRPLWKLCTRIGRLSQGVVARQHRAALLLISPHDHARDDFHHPDGLCRNPEPARPAGIQHAGCSGC